MKKILFALSAITFIACGPKEATTASIVASNNIKEIKAQRTLLLGELQTIENALIKLDTVKKLALVSTLKTKPTNFMHYVEVQGNVKTKQNLIVYPQFNGSLKSLLVSKGDKVSKGQTIGIIDDSGLKDQLEQVKTATLLAQTTFERQERLWNQNIGSEIQYLQAKTNYQAQQKAVSQLEAQVENTNIKAPFSGIIDDVFSEEGTLVAAGQSPIVRVINLNNMTIDANIPEIYLENVKKGKKVLVDFPVLGVQAETTIAQAGNFINPNSRNFQVEMNVPKNINAKPNMSVRLKINDYHNENAVLIPQSIISENEKNEQYVYTIVKENGIDTAHKAFVKTGKTNGDLIEVLDGLANNTQVVLEGARTVREGQQVTVLN
ncbi:efflux RND transporter periplasmic adaptor subunit [Flavobacteriaceae bacterium]|nr:efflux RND transporter periplasmic adaptor subunit [Flavobacteriaceae bacterium]